MPKRSDASTDGGLLPCLVHQRRGPEKPTWRCRDRLWLSFAWLAPSNRGAFNSTHIHGTCVPVEEPSTASREECLAQAGTVEVHFFYDGRSGPPPPAPRR